MIDETKTSARPDLVAVRVRVARWPKDLPAAQHLFTRYFESLRTDPSVPPEIRTKDRAPELNGLATRYRDSTACLLLAFAGEQIVGCAAVTQLKSPNDAVEMKRLYVLPEARGRGAGRALIQACATWARERGARELLLDTLPDAMPEAVRLYRSLGFEPTARYNENEGRGFAFFRLALE
ncbi:GNAT family N-acetyltransferase [Terriglobus sp.]|uniref:GNAT family N-acetyltransferase n=1 Tax=Terriglobus sp. TaxID=1889013 RepID=UPI003B00E418